MNILDCLKKKKKEDVVSVVSLPAEVWIIFLSIDLRFFRTNPSGFFLLQSLFFGHVTARSSDRGSLISLFPL